MTEEDKNSSPLDEAQKLLHILLKLHMQQQRQ